jgi:sporulation protein YlmC with PRC-barrel domain
MGSRCQHTTTMNMPVRAQVHCADGPCGRCTQVIVNPRTQQVTHLVVKPGKAPRTERLVPMKFVMGTERNVIRLGCTKGELAKTEPFIETEWVQVDLRYFDPLLDEDLAEYSGCPFAILVDQVHVPPGELAVHRHVRVKATDKQVGRVGEFLVDPVDGRITHLVLCKGSPWGQKKVNIPASQIDRIEDTIHLKLDTLGVKALTGRATNRRWRRR